MWRKHGVERALNDLGRNCGVATVSSIVSFLFHTYNYFVSMFFYPLVNRDHK
jgi:hypothetical protein